MSVKYYKLQRPQEHNMGNDSYLFAEFTDGVLTSFLQDTWKNERYWTPWTTGEPLVAYIEAEWMIEEIEKEEIFIELL